ncbi:VCBS repeat protein [Streptomyces sp. 2333.5]|uniref:FG-GAP repeat domain-containing protein n=1 Tax=Streptomyces TaxID=1883 RepID=UPI00089CFE04|nr:MULTISPECIES: VCBS repeat-containing protein [unclassified Streptomyces]PJJ02947.1 VCBS repeat protein [Streptomyces sp. 2333.5]SEE22694.1 Repeat domain-containing protein [Streptomyces sp. 2112.2]SOE12699.1 Repeat domain-containing protein [Streptomyces sp. 2323.1]
MRGRSAAAAGLGLALALLLSSCGPLSSSGAGRPAARHRASSLPAARPVPAGHGSRTAHDFNGDGHPDLVVDSLLAPAKGHDDDPGIGIVYGSAHGLAPATRELLTPARNAAPIGRSVPASFEAETVCDLDQDGFSDLVVTTDPPYDGIGRPPVPVQLLFGSSRGLGAGRAVQLRIPDRARFGNEWPDQPVCGDFDGDGAADLAVTASGPRISYLRGPFTRTGAPKAAGAPINVPGTALATAAPLSSAADLDHDGADDLLVRAAAPGHRARSRLALGGPRGPVRAGPAAYPSGYATVFGHFSAGGRGPTPVTADTNGLLSVAGRPGTLRTGTGGIPTLAAAEVTGDGYTDLVIGGTRPALLVGSANGLSTTVHRPTVPRVAGTGRPLSTVLALTDFDGDGHADLVLLTRRGHTHDRVTVHPGGPSGLAPKPAVSFTTADFTTS